MTNFLSGFDGEIVNLYCRSEQINNNICKKYFQITETQLLKNILNKKNTVGKKIAFKDVNDIRVVTKTTEEEKSASFYGFFRNHRLKIFLWIREFFWKFGNWKNERLLEFLDETKPDIIMMPIYDSRYMYNILFYVHKHTNAKVVLCTGDDIYSFKKKNMSPFSWIEKLLLRRSIRKAVGISDLRFSLTNKQSDEYSKIFNKPFFTVRKSVENYEMVNSSDVHEPIRMAYTGNIMLDRHKTLGKIGKALDVINKDSVVMTLDVYTANKLTKRMKKAFEYKGINYCGAVSSEEVTKIQNDADILLHVEGFSKKSRLAVRLSLSTKIVDYLAKGKCVLAVAPNDVASMEYLMCNDAAICVDNEKKIYETLKNILENNQIIFEYQKKSIECIKNNHCPDVNREELYRNLEKIVNTNN